MIAIYNFLHNKTALSGGFAFYCHPELDSGSGFRVKPGMTKDEEFIFY